MSKILEKAVHTQLYAYLCNNHLLSDKQFGSVTTTAQFTRRISLTLLRKAFDMVNQSLLLSKLNSLSVLDHSTARKWFESYLSNRCQVSACNNNQSNKAIVSNGVQQGSSLGPLLFTVYIND